MTTLKIIYFTADVTPTADEVAEIDALNALTLGAYSVSVRNGNVSASYGDVIESSDLVAGTIPTEFAAVEDYGDIGADRPVLLQIMQAAQEVAAAATLQLQVIAVDGTTAANLVATDVTASTADTTYASDDEAVATVSAEGLVTGVAAGEAIITATNEFDTSKTVETTVTITVPA